MANVALVSKSVAITLTRTRPADSDPDLPILAILVTAPKLQG